MTMFLSATGNVYMQTTYANDLIYNLKNAVKTHLLSPKVAIQDKKKIAEKVPDPKNEDRLITKFRDVYYYTLKGFENKGKTILVNNNETASKVLESLGLQDYFNTDFFKTFDKLSDKLSKLEIKNGSRIVKN